MFKQRFLKAVSAFTCAAMIFSASTMAFAEDSIESIGDEAKAPSTDLTSSDMLSKDMASMDMDLANAPLTDLEGETADIGEAENETPAAESDFYKYTDVSSHWAAEALKKAYEDGIIKGFENNTMRPDDKITGAQMVTVLTRVLNANEKADLLDVAFPEECWYIEEAAKAVRLGIIDKSEIAGLDGKMLRKNAVAMMSEAFQLENSNPDLTAAAEYSDFNTLELSEKILFASLVNHGYIKGWDGSLQLANDITRAEFITLLYRVAEEYTKEADIKAFSSITEPTVISGQDVSISKETISADLWLDTSVKTVNLNKIKAKRLTLRSDNLSSLKVNSSNIERLVLAAVSGNINLDCIGIDTTVVGDGDGAVILAPYGNNIEITGSNREISIERNVKNVFISGDNNKITFSSAADAENVTVYGKNNGITIDSDVNELEVVGKYNEISGNGRARNASIGTATSKIGIRVFGTLTDSIDYGIVGMTATVSAPEKVDLGKDFIVTADLQNAPSGKIVTAQWSIEGKAVKSEQVELQAGEKLQTTQNLTYMAGLPDKVSIGLTIKYTTYDGEEQTVTAPLAYVEPDKTNASYFDAIVAKVETKYKGNFTTQWAIEHNLSDYEKEIFVNYKGYSSSSKYLIWVNIGTQYTSVFEGSQGKWKLLRTGLVSTGAGDCTPRGVFKTTYKQTNWTTDSYTVRPVVRFYGGGYAMHSRLYKPGTTTLKGGKNGVGYPLSHGCVRMQADDIQWVYDNVPSGTTIVVY